MKHPTEDVLIAYVMHESVQGNGIAEHLEHCPDCASTAESIAETLRVFSAEPVPQANLDRAWQRIRGSLLPLSRPSRHRWSWSWLLLPAASGALLIAFITVHRRPTTTHSGSTASLSARPLTVQPRDPELASYLDSAERLLTELKHSSDPPDEVDRRQAHDLLLSNALYIRKIRKADDGDNVDAIVLDRLDRTLTNLEHEPTPEPSGVAQMNTESLLLDLRILQQNNSAPAKESQ